MKSTALGVQRLAIDPAAAVDLRAKLRQDPQTGVKQAAQQFEPAHAGQAQVFAQRRGERALSLIGCGCGRGRSGGRGCLQA